MMNTIEIIEQPTAALAPTPAPAGTFGPSKRPPRGPRVLVSSWPWRSLLYIVVSIAIGLTWMAVVATWISAGVGGFFFGGFVAIAALPLTAIALGATERWLLGLMGYGPVETPHARPLQPGIWAWLKLRWTEAATWREAGFGALLSVLAIVDAVVLTLAAGIVGGLIAAPVVKMSIDNGTLTPGNRQLFDAIDRGFAMVNDSWVAVVLAPVAGLLLIVLLAWAGTAYARGRATLSHWLVAAPAPDPAVLQQSRARIVNSFDFERQRIERDIHDGPQQQLTALLMTLGLAKDEATDAPEGVRTLIGEAQSQAQTALNDLRNLVQGIHPSLLTDRGLVAAVEAMTRQLPIDVTLTAEVNRPVPQHIEVAAYFVISEALTNVAKHSGSASASVLIRTDAARLIVAVTDNGVGGAEPGRGSGLVGIDDRIQAVGGTMVLTSPAGGPTVLRVELPCG